MVAIRRRAGRHGPGVPRRRRKRARRGGHRPGLRRGQVRVPSRRPFDGHVAGHFRHPQRPPEPACSKRASGIATRLHRAGPVPANAAGRLGRHRHSDRVPRSHRVDAAGRPDHQHDDAVLVHPGPGDRRRRCDRRGRADPLPPERARRFAEGSDPRNPGRHRAGDLRRSDDDGGVRAVPVRSRHDGQLHPVVPVDRHPGPVLLRRRIATRAAQPPFAQPAAGSPRPEAHARPRLERLLRRFRRRPAMGRRPCLSTGSGVLPGMALPVAVSRAVVDPDDRGALLRRHRPVRVLPDHRLGQRHRQADDAPGNAGRPDRERRGKHRTGRSRTGRRPRIRIRNLHLHARALERRRAAQRQFRARRRHPSGGRFRARPSATGCGNGFRRCRAPWRC